MTPEEQTAICKVIAGSCMWGHSGIGSVILDELQKRLPMERSWHQVHRENARKAEYEKVGVIRTREEVEYYLRYPDKYSICNYRPGEMSIHLRHNGCSAGLLQYIVGALADELAPIYDAWNFKHYQQRAASSRS